LRSYRKPTLPKKRWPKIVFKEKRAATWKEHRAIVAGEHNPERRAYYECCWQLGGSQSDFTVAPRSRGIAFFHSRERVQCGSGVRHSASNEKRREAGTHCKQHRGGRGGDGYTAVDRPRPWHVRWREGERSQVRRDAAAPCAVRRAWAKASDASESAGKLLVGPSRFSFPYIDRFPRPKIMSAQEA